MANMTPWKVCELKSKPLEINRNIVLIVCVFCGSVDRGFVGGKGREGRTKRTLT